MHERCIISTLLLCWLEDVLQRWSWWTKYDDADAVSDDIEEEDDDGGNDADDDYDADDNDDEKEEE